MLNDIFQSIDPIIFSVGPIALRWYGLAYVLGFVLAAFVVSRNAKRWGIDFEAYDVLVFVCFCAFGVIIGGRLGYCLFYGDGFYLEHPAKILAVNEGGMSFHGGLIGILIGGILYSVTHKMSFLTLADLVACGAPLGLFFGRCANFINGELYGAPTNSVLGVDFTGSGIMYTPSQLYEACLEGLVIFIVLFVLSRKIPARPQGTFLGTFLILYAIFRCCIEFVRLPDSQIGYFFGTWGTMGQALCIPMFLLGIGLLIFAWRAKRPQRGMSAGA